jgi:hypothetical protein
VRKEWVEEEVVVVGCQDMVSQEEDRSSADQQERKDLDHRRLMGGRVEYSKEMRRL